MQCPLCSPREGNLVGKTRAGGGESWSYGYDHENRMVWAERRDAGGALAQRAEYRYDALGNRIEKAVAPAVGPAQVTRFAYDGGHAWADLDGSGALLARRLYLDGIDQVFARIGAGGEAAWYLTDRLGSVRDVADATGAVRDHLEYDAFGKVLSETDASFGDRYKYTGREYDAETGLQYNRARYYDAGTGRWTSEDPLGFAAGDANLYRYAGNGPTNATDPSGLFDLDALPGRLAARNPLVHEYLFQESQGMLVARDYGLLHRMAVSVGTDWEGWKGGPYTHKPVLHLKYDLGDEEALAAVIHEVERWQSFQQWKRRKLYGIQAEMKAGNPWAGRPGLSPEAKSFIADLVPGVSQAKGATEAIAGADPHTGRELGTGERVVAGMAVVPGGKLVGKLLGTVWKFVRRGAKVADAAGAAAKTGASLADVPCPPPSRVAPVQGAGATERAFGTIAPYAPRTPNLPQTATMAQMLEWVDSPCPGHHDHR